MSEIKPPPLPPAQRHDAGKPPLSLLPFLALEQVALVLRFGAQKYDRHQWLGGMDWDRCEDSLLRHYSQWQRGQDLDAESGLRHMAHVTCNALFLLTFELLGRGRDTRPKEAYRTSREET